MLVYDITKRESFDKIQSWQKQAEQNSSNIPFILVGNKSDLETQREVNYEEGAKYAEEHEYPFFEVSALDNTGIDDMFLKMVQLVLPNKKKSMGMKKDRTTLKNKKKEKPNGGSGCH